jgi:hypothetical protein
MKLKRKKTKKDNHKWEIFEVILDLIEPVYLLIRFVVRFIAKIVN